MRALAESWAVDWVAGLSPYEHVPRVPVKPTAAVPGIVLGTLAAIVVATAWRRYTQRDIG